MSYVQRVARSLFPLLACAPWTGLFFFCSFSFSRFHAKGNANKVVGLSVMSEEGKNEFAEDNLTNCFISSLFFPILQDRPNFFSSCHSPPLLPPPSWHPFKSRIDLLGGNERRANYDDYTFHRSLLDFSVSRFTRKRCACFSYSRFLVP